MRGAHKSKLSRYFVCWVIAPFVGLALTGRVLDLGAEGGYGRSAEIAAERMSMSPEDVEAGIEQTSLLKRLPNRRRHGANGSLGGR